MICPINGHRQPNALAGSSGFFGVPVELNGTGVCRCNSGENNYVMTGLIMMMMMMMVMAMGMMMTMTMTMM